LIRSLLNYVRLPIKTLSISGLVLASTIIIAGLAAWTLSDFSDVLAGAETIVSSTAIAMDSVARNSLEAVDGVLEAVLDRIAEEGIANIASESEREKLQRFVRRLPGTGAIHIADDGGTIVAAVPSLRNPINVGDREWFRSLKDERVDSQGRGFRRYTYVGRPLPGDTAGNLFFPVARSIRGPDGAFLGAVQAGVEVAYFSHVFEALDAGFRSLQVRSEEKLGMYLTKDGSVVATFPMTEALLGESVAASPYFSLLANSEGQSWTGWTREGGERHLVSARSLRGWPLIVSISLPKSEVYSFAWTRLLWRSLVALMTIAALSLLAVLANRQVRREAVIMAELEHRVRNTLAVVATVIERTRDDTKSIDEFVSSLRGRIQAMVATQTLLGQSRRSVSVADLVSTELRPYATVTNTSVDGPPAYLLPAASYALGMVLHELATNAAKYGALSQPGGKVSVRWRQTAEPSSAPMLRIEWKETGGPQVAAPAREGYGSSVIRELLTYEFGGRVNLIFEPDGVRCTIELTANAETAG
jgi:two-component sensor histidine kinase